MCITHTLSYHIPHSIQSMRIIYRVHFFPNHIPPHGTFHLFYIKYYLDIPFIMAIFAFNFNSWGSLVHSHPIIIIGFTIHIEHQIINVRTEESQSTASTWKIIQ